ncbi:prolyl oligopeptidase family serine peptidase [Amycolatopsis sp. cmx-4-68]|uniref:prolyl oligopeptidase family serine peptidase n=1 Tax=Amycolatopsis sp. cmx-4-68 TaxID=2790938 RepID=UPI00397C022B
MPNPLTGPEVRVDEPVRVTRCSADEDVLHGVTVPDPFRWLEDGRAPEVRAWCAEQNARTARFLARAADVGSFAGLLAAAASGGRVSIPSVSGGRAVWAQRDPGAARMGLVVRDAGAAGTRTLVDAADPRLADGVVVGWGVDPTGTRAFLQATVDAGEACVVHLLDLATGEPAGDPITGTRYSDVGWSRDGSRIFAVRRGTELVVRRVGAAESTDRVVFTAAAGRIVTQFACFGAVVAVVDHDPRTGRSLVRVLRLTESDTTEEEPLDVDESRVVVHPSPDGELMALHWRDDPTGRIERWRAGVGWQPVPHGTEVIIEDFAVLRERGGLALIRLGRAGGSSVLVRSLLDTGAPLGEIPLPGEGSVDGVRADETGAALYYSYTDFAVPHEIWRFDPESGRPELFVRQPGTARLPAVRSERFTLPGADGRPVGVTLLSPADETRPRPILLTAYGGFGVPTRPRFSPFALAWVASGGAYAVAAVRGGGEQGRDWHQEAVRSRRQVSIDDLNACAAGLRSGGKCADGVVVVQGGSNGGLLAAAALTQRPDLYTAALLTAPLADMVRYERHGLGPRWVREYGSVSDEDEFAALHAYSPYHRALAGVADIPPTLIAVLDEDTRVDPLHGRKLCAALQANGECGERVYLRSHSSVGHGGKPVAREIDINAELLAFAAHCAEDRR